MTVSDDWDDSSSDMDLATAPSSPSWWNAERREDETSDSSSSDESSSLPSQVNDIGGDTAFDEWTPRTPRQWHVSYSDISWTTEPPIFFVSNDEPLSSAADVDLNPSLPGASGAMAIVENYEAILGFQSITTPVQLPASTLSWEQVHEQLFSGMPSFVSRVTPSPAPSHRSTPSSSSSLSSSPPRTPFESALNPTAHAFIPSFRKDPDGFFIAVDELPFQPFDNSDHDIWVVKPSKEKRKKDLIDALKRRGERNDGWIDLSGASQKVTLVKTSNGWIDVNPKPQPPQHKRSTAQQHRKKRSQGKRHPHQHNPPPQFFPITPTPPPPPMFYVGAPMYDVYSRVW